MNESRYTTILHGKRIKYGMTCNDYCIADSIHKLSSSPEYPVCVESQEALGEFIGISRRSVITIIQKLIEIGMVKKISEQGRHIGFKSTKLWYDEFVIKRTGGEESSQGVQEALESGETSSQIGVKKVHRNSEESSHNSNNNYKDNKKDKQHPLFVTFLKSVVDPINDARNKDRSKKPLSAKSIQEGFECWLAGERLPESFN